MNAKAEWRRQDRRMWRGKRFSVYKPLTQWQVIGRSVGFYFVNLPIGWCKSGSAVGGHVDPVLTKCPAIT